MASHSNRIPDTPRLRLRAGVILAALLLLFRYVVAELGSELEVAEFPVTILGLGIGMSCGVAIVIWWTFFSRAPWSDRLMALLAIAGSLAAIKFVVHESIAGGAQEMLAYILAFPTTCLGLVIGAAAGDRRPPLLRRLALVAGVLVGCGIWTLARSEGVVGGAIADLEWRWTPTAEERLLAEVRDEPPAAPAAAPTTPAPEKPDVKAEAPPAEAAANTATTPSASKHAPGAPAVTMAAAMASERKAARAEWPGFRGPARDGVVRGVRIATEWSQQQPVELWRRPIGPGWSSLAVAGDVVYTQEQRGDDEIVSAYNFKTGEPVWRHRDAARFWESNGGAGPRGTPAVSGGRVFALGATGILNALDAANGALFWTRNAATDTAVEVPYWGIASSPIVIDDLVVVAVSGRLAAYDTATGSQRWLGPAGGTGYSSPHVVTIDGVPQILLLRGSRTISVAPADGTLLWQHTWTPGVGIVQPAFIPDDGVLVTVGDAMGGLGVRRLNISRGETGWTIEERWTSRGLKPYFNDFVIHKGHAFGFDGSILACIDLADGERRWKGGRYGNGQLVLLADQDLLLVMSEEGEIALVSATADKFTEIARFQALDAKTWNHPVVIGDVLLVRNGEEMAAFKLPVARAATR